MGEGGGGLICKVGAEVTCQADLRLEESPAVWARDGAEDLALYFLCKYWYFIKQEFCVVFGNQFFTNLFQF